MEGHWRSSVGRPFLFEVRCLQSYPPELKAQVIADFQLGASKSALSKKYNVPRTTVIDWVTSHEPPIPTVTDIQKRDELGVLVYEYLATGLRALIAQARAMGDPEWFKGQGETAHQLHGTLADKLVIIFAGVERGRSDSGDGPA